jgi:hypothetical protein
VPLKPGPVAGDARTRYGTVQARPANWLGAHLHAGGAGSPAPALESTRVGAGRLRPKRSTSPLAGQTTGPEMIMCPRTQTAQANTRLGSLRTRSRTGPAARLLLGFLVLVRLVGPASSEAATVWTGPLTTFTKLDGADPTQAINQDRLTPNVWITRASSQGLYNAKTESFFTHGLSPADTEWANGTTADYATLSYTDWNTWANGVNPGPPSTVGVSAVLHLISDDIYIDIQFIAWSGRGGSGGFAYVRSTPPPGNPPSVAITSLSVMGGTVSINFAGSPTDAPSAFTLLSSAAVHGTYATALGASIIQVSPGLFQATVPTNGPSQFYRILK